jgi:hypothetical protein
MVAAFLAGLASGSGADLLGDLTLVVVVVVTATVTAWALLRWMGGLTPDRRAIVAPGAASAPKGTTEMALDHERRLLVIEAKSRALEMEWEDTRAKFLGMTRSFIRQAKAAGLDGTDASGVNPDLRSGATPGAGASVTSSRAAVLNQWKRRNGHAQP